MEPELISQIEDNIVARLLSALPDCKVLPFPEDIDDFAKPTQSAQVFIGFRGETLTEPNQTIQTSKIIQQRTLTFDLILRTKDLRTHRPVYTLADKVRTSLTGFPPAAKVKPMYQTSSGFTNLAQAIWLYTMTFACVTGFTQTPDR